MRAEVFSYRLDVLYRGLGISKIAIFDPKRYKKNVSIIDMKPDSVSGFTSNAGSKSGFATINAVPTEKYCGNTAMNNFIISSVADPDPGSGIRCLFYPWIRDPEWVFPDPGSRISDPGSRIPDLGSRIPDLGSRIWDPGSQDHILKSFLTIFLVKSSIIL